jgi:hypothetical protein
MNKIAVAMPGKMGDVLYCLTAVRWLCKKHNAVADFWTSEYCRPLKRLMEYQSCIDQFLINEDYVMDHMGLGIQPWYLPVPNENEYEAVYQAGIREVPQMYIPDHICKSLDIPMNQKVYYEYEDMATLDKEYIIVAPRGEDFWTPLIKDLDNGPSKVNIVQIGAKGDYVGDIGIDKTGLDFLETTAWIAKSKVFMGCASSQLVIAEGFSMSRYMKPPLQNILIGITEESLKHN